MGRPKGIIKTGGRKKGAKNRVPSVADLHEMCAAKGVNVFEALLEYVYTPSDNQTRLAAIKELMKYLYPQLKAMELTGGVQLNHRNLEQLPDNDLDTILIEPNGRSN